MSAIDTSTDLFRDATKMVSGDYFAVYTGPGRFLSNVFAKDGKDAMRIGKSGYYAELAKAFRC
jgi:hypothetical protein